MRPKNFPFVTFQPKRFLLLFALLAVCGGALLVLVSAREPSASAATTDAATSGALQVVGGDGQLRALCPLKHTDVHAEVSGFLSRVTVTQEFENPFKEKIEAVYVFPLPQAAAVDDMTLKVGERTVRGKIMRREEAQAVYDAARAGGQVAGLLDQERPNVFTQSVANIMPGERVTVKISYVETLKYEDGSYEFSFPMVVGPRYVPGAPLGRPSTGGGRLPDTDQVPDASRITPPVAPKGMRAGHDISLSVNLDAGVRLEGLRSNSHEVVVERRGEAGALVRLRNGNEIPNKDFVLRYDVAGRQVQDALLTHRDGRGGYFTFILQPPERVAVEDVMPKELVFVLDTSGSMNGFPLEKARETMKLALDGLYPQDTFNLITFAGDTHVLFPRPVPATRENLARAQRFLDSRQGSGGTEMMKAIRTALEPSDSQSHVRIVCFMTDGYVGNDMEIISEVQKYSNARVFSFGIGSSVNRFLLDKMAEHGRGEVEYVSLSDDGSAAARRFHERVRQPLLTDVSIEWGNLQVADVYPKRIPDLFSAKPVVLSGRYLNGGRGVIRLKGRTSGRHFEREIAVNLPEAEPAHDVLATLWARRRVEDVMAEDMRGAQYGTMRDDLRETVTQLGLEYRLMTQFTSFVAVEEMTITEGGQPRRIEVPVELPEGVSRLAVGEDEEVERLNHVANFSVATPAAPRAMTTARRSRSEGGVGAGMGPPPPPSGKPMPTHPTANANASVRLSEAAKESRREASAVSTEEQRRRDAAAKMHPALRALVERLSDRNSRPSAEEAKFVRDGKAEVQVWLTEKSPEVLEQLKRLGFEVVLDPQTAKLVIGRLPVEKLSALVELRFVRYVAPQQQSG